MPEAAPASVPTGTVTFLFTDIEGSTLRWERFPDAMRDAVRRHDEIVRDAVARGGGHVFKTIGDAFCVAFANPIDGVAAAVDAQRRLLAADFSAVDGVRVRMALHTGTADERDGDYFGPTVNRVARIAAVGHGGQILVSSIAGELVRSDLSADLALRDLGEYRLKDLILPERIFQVVAPDLADGFPRLRTFETVQTNLPAAVSSFVGRERELETLKALIAEHRLVTIVGPGGVGKTRISLRLGESVLDAFGGVWFVDLAPLVDPALVADQIATVLGVRGVPQRQLLDGIAAAIGDRRLLLVIDNCEHLVEAAATAIAGLLQRCTHLVVLATSREALGIAGEQQFQLPPLAIDEAVRLFVERANAANRAFRLTDANEKTIVEVCKRLDALPFALELAAPRLVVLTPQQLYDRLGERLRLLQSPSRSGPERTRTLGTLIAWSFALLTEPERTLFRRLSAFAGSWTIDTAAVVGLAESLDGDILDPLSSLVTKSMVVSDASAPGGATRFRFLESMRQFAAERLAEAGERELIERRLAIAMLAFVRDAVDALRHSDEAAWLDGVEAEIDNLRVVLQRAFAEGGDAELGAEIVASLGFFWHARRPIEGAYWLGLAREAAGSYQKVLEARVFLESARVEIATENSVAYAERSVAAYREVGDRNGLGRSLEYLGQSLVNVGRFAEAETALTESIELLGADGVAIATSRARALRGAARIFDRRGTEQTKHELTEAFDELVAAGRKRDATMALRGLVMLAVDDGRLGDAIALLERALHLTEDLNDPRGTGILRGDLAGAFLRDGRFVEARANALESLRLLRTADVPRAISISALMLAAALAALDDAATAARVIGFARAHALTPSGEPYFLPTIRTIYDATCATLQAALGDAAFERALKDGAQLDADFVARGARQESAAQLISG
jgi:predicted ATPase/class 3 adenylate cyclase